MSPHVPKVVDINLRREVKPRPTHHYNRLGTLYHQCEMNVQSNISYHKRLKCIIRLVSPDRGYRIGCLSSMKFTRHIMSNIKALERICFHLHRIILMLSIHCSQEPCHTPPLINLFYYDCNSYATLSLGEI